MVASKGSTIMRYVGKKKFGSAIVFAVVGMVVFVGFASLSVDYARIQVAKTQLHNAVDAAARAGVAAVGQGPTIAINQAVTYAALNMCDGTPVAIDPNLDVDFGTYDGSTRVFTKLTGTARSAATAIQVTGRRTAARGNPIHLLFAQMVGMPTKDLTTSAVASLSSTRLWYIGVNLTRMFNTARFDAYDSSAGNYSLSNALPGKLYGNTNLWLHDT